MRPSHLTHPAYEPTWINPDIAALTPFNQALQEGGWQILAGTDRYNGNPVAWVSNPNQGDLGFNMEVNLDTQEHGNITRLIFGAGNDLTSVPYAASIVYNGANYLQTETIDVFGDGNTTTLATLELSERLTPVHVSDKAVLSLDDGGQSVLTRTSQQPTNTYKFTQPMFGLLPGTDIACTNQGFSVPDNNGNFYHHFSTSISQTPITTTCGWLTIDEQGNQLPYSHTLEQDNTSGSLHLRSRIYGANFEPTMEGRLPIGRQRDINSTYTLSAEQIGRPSDLTFAYALSEQKTNGVNNQACSFALNHNTPQRDCVEQNIPHNPSVKLLGVVPNNDSYSPAGIVGDNSPALLEKGSCNQQDIPSPGNYRSAASSHQRQRLEPTRVATAPREPLPITVKRGNARSDSNQCDATNSATEPQTDKKTNHPTRKPGETDIPTKGETEPKTAKQTPERPPNDANKNAIIGAIAGGAVAGVALVACGVANAVSARKNKENTTRSFYCWPTCFRSHKVKNNNSQGNGGIIFGYFLCGEHIKKEKSNRTCSDLLIDFFKWASCYKPSVRPAQDQDQDQDQSLAHNP